MKALVTGATGFVGSHLAEALRRRGDEVTALARSLKKAEALRPLAVRVVQGDLDDKAALAQAVDGQDVIYHVAGAIAARSEDDFMASNREGTRNVVAAAVAAGGPRFVLVSSMAAGGPSPRGRPLKGDEPPLPVTRYGRSKLAAEEVVRASGLPWTIVRPPMVYGPRDREVLKVFRIARLGIAPVFGDGTQELSAVHGADLADALIAAAITPATIHRIYYASHPDVFTTTHFVRERRRSDGPAGRGGPGTAPARPRRSSPSPKPPRAWPASRRSSPPTRPTNSSRPPGPAIRRRSLATPGGARNAISTPASRRRGSGIRARDGCSGTGRDAAEPVLLGRLLPVDSSCSATSPSSPWSRSCGHRVGRSAGGCCRRTHSSSCCSSCSAAGMPGRSPACWVRSIPC